MFCSPGLSLITASIELVCLTVLVYHVLAVIWVLRIKYVKCCANKVYVSSQHYKCYVQQSSLVHITHTTHTHTYTHTHTHTHTHELT